jgi:hypothetical protein
MRKNRHELALCGHLMLLQMERTLISLCCFERETSRGNEKKEETERERNDKGKQERNKKLEK